MVRRIVVGGALALILAAPTSVADAKKCKRRKCEDRTGCGVGCENAGPQHDDPLRLALVVRAGRLHPSAVGNVYPRVRCPRTRRACRGTLVLRRDRHEIGVRAPFIVGPRSTAQVAVGLPRRVLDQVLAGEEIRVRVVPRLQTLRKREALVTAPARISL